MLLVYQTLVKPLRALCSYQLEHGAVVHHSKQYLIEHGLYVKPQPHRRTAVAPSSGGDGEFKTTKSRRPGRHGRQKTGARPYFDYSRSPQMDSSVMISSAAAAAAAEDPDDDRTKSG